MNQDIADRLEILEEQRAEARQMRKEARRMHKKKRPNCYLYSSTLRTAVSGSAIRKMRKAGLTPTLRQGNKLFQCEIIRVKNNRRARSDRVTDKYDNQCRHN